MPSPHSIASSSSSSGSRTRIYLAVWLANSKFKYGVILAQKNSSGDGLGHVFNRTSYSQHDMKQVRDAQLAGAMLLCKVECNSPKEDQLRAYLATLYREGKHKDDEQALLNLAVKYLFEKQYIKATATVNQASAVRDLQRAVCSPARGVVVKEITGHLSMCRGHAERSLPVCDVQGNAIDSEIPAMVRQQRRGSDSKHRKDAFSKHRVDY